MSGSLRDALIARITEYARDIVTVAQQGILDELDRLVPVAAEGGGTLRDSRVVRFAEGPTTMGFEVTYPVDYAVYTDLGTVAHEIPGPLAFFWKEVGAWVIVPAAGKIKGGGTFWTKDGKLIIGKGHVDHPGTTGTFWWSDTINDAFWADELILAAESVR